MTVFFSLLVSAMCRTSLNTRVLDNGDYSTEALERQISALAARPSFAALLNKALVKRLEIVLRVKMDDQAAPFAAAKEVNFGAQGFAETILQRHGLC